MNQQLDMPPIKRAMTKLIPDLTFKEAYETTGRSFNISISPTEPSQKSPLLKNGAAA